MVRMNLLYVHGRKKIYQIWCHPTALCEWIFWDGDQIEGIIIVIFVNRNYYVLFQMSLQFDPKIPVVKKKSGPICLNQLSHNSMTYICDTRPRWFNHIFTAADWSGLNLPRFIVELSISPIQRQHTFIINGYRMSAYNSHPISHFIHYFPLHFAGLGLTFPVVGKKDNLAGNEMTQIQNWLGYRVIYKFYYIL